jgi:hypothetical protein
MISSAKSVIVLPQIITLNSPKFTPSSAERSLAAKKMGLSCFITCQNHVIFRRCFSGFLRQSGMK